MLSFTLPDADKVNSVAVELSDAGLDLVPAAVAAMVLVALSAALVITALRRREAERERPHAEESDEAAYGRPARADA